MDRVGSSERRYAYPKDTSGLLGGVVDEVMVLAAVRSVCGARSSSNVCVWESVCALLSQPKMLINVLAIMNESNAREQHIREQEREA